MSPGRPDGLTKLALISVDTPVIHCPFVATASDPIVSVRLKISPPWTVCSTNQVGAWYKSQQRLLQLDWLRESMRLYSLESCHNKPRTVVLFDLERSFHCTGTCGKNIELDENTFSLTLQFTKFTPTNIRKTLPVMSWTQFPVRGYFLHRTRGTRLCCQETTSIPRKSRQVGGIILQTCTYAFRESHACCHDRGSGWTGF